MSFVISRRAQSCTFSCSRTWSSCLIMDCVSSIFRIPQPRSTDDVDEPSIGCICPVLQKENFISSEGLGVRPGLKASSRISPQALVTGGDEALLLECCGTLLAGLS